MGRDYKEDFLKYAGNVKRDGISRLISWLNSERNDFFVAPASTRFHHSFRGGLVQHSVEVYENLARLNEVFDAGFSDESLLVCGLFHDLCKVFFYVETTRNVKDENGRWQQEPYFKVEDKMPLGHGEKSVIILQQYLKLGIDEVYAIRWHMGGFDTTVKGGDYGLGEAYNYCKLPVMLNSADMLSSYGVVCE